MGTIGRTDVPSLVPILTSKDSWFDYRPPGSKGLRLSLPVSIRHLITDLLDPMPSAHRIHLRLRRSVVNQ